jgi:hypothetical protein
MAALQELVKVKCPKTRPNKENNSRSLKFRNNDHRFEQAEAELILRMGFQVLLGGLIFR